MKNRLFDLMVYFFVAISLMTISQSLSYVFVSQAVAVIEPDIPKPISATFNEAMDEATLTSDTFTVKDWDGSSIAGTVSLSSDGKTAIFTPSMPLQASVDYTATISSEAKDRAGNSLVADKVWSFTIPAATTDNNNYNDYPEIQQSSLDTFDYSPNSSSVANAATDGLHQYAASVLPPSSDHTTATDDTNTETTGPQNQDQFSIPLTDSNNNNPLETGGVLPGQTITGPTSDTEDLPQQLQQSQQQQLSPFTSAVQDIVPPETVITSAIDGNNFPLLQTITTSNGIVQTYSPYLPYTTTPSATPNQIPTSPLTSTGITASNSITFSFTGIDSSDGSTNTITDFECRYDSSLDFIPCTNPTVLQDLAPGSMHVIEVRAVDAAGNRDLSPAIFSWITGMQDLLAQQQQPLQQQPQQSQQLASPLSGIEQQLLPTPTLP